MPAADMRGPLARHRRSGSADQSLCHRHLSVADIERVTSAWEFGAPGVLVPLCSGGTWGCPQLGDEEWFNVRARRGR